MNKTLNIRNIGIVAITSLFMAMAISSTEDTSKPSSTSPTNKTALGASLQIGGIEASILNVQVSQGFKGVLDDVKAPSQGGIFVVVNWKYKNVSKEPLGMFDRPSINLISHDGVEYSADIDASSDYASQAGDDEKAVSDLNPGLVSNVYEVFEVSKDLFDSGTWSLRISHDGSTEWFSMK
ncbi:MAG: DUF4352 domain-containing protein [Verrucomicrobia bacterium]|nr:DUF4352 domain-containing protein [Verrucomicrobiota bacterium]